LNIAKEIKEDQVGVITVTLAPEDYADQFTDQLKKYRKQAQLPGFRPGTVPMGLIRKRFGPSLLFDQLSRNAMDELMKYVQAEEMKVLGRPYLMRSNLTDEVKDDLEQNEYFFEFQMGIQPDVALQIDQLPKLTQYTVAVSEQDVDEYILDLRYKSGSVAPAEAVADVQTRRYIVQTQLEELAGAAGTDPLAAGEGFSSKLYIHTRFEPKVVKKLEGAKPGDSLEVKLTDLFDSEHAAMSVLEISHEYYHELETKTFRITVEQIEEQQPAEANVAWFNKMFRLEEAEAEKQIKDEADFRARVKDYLQQEYTTQAERQYEADFIRALLNAHPFPLPISFIRQFLLDEAKDDRERKNIDENLSNYLVEFRLRFIYDAILAQNEDLKVSEEQVKESIKKKFRAYMQPLQAAEGEDAEEAAKRQTEMEQRLDQLAESFAQSQEMLERESRTAQDVRIKDWLLETKFELEARTLSASEFNKATQEPAHHH
jgi:trigger factor